MAIEPDESVGGQPATAEVVAAATSYEFDAEQNKLIGNLGWVIWDVGNFLMLVGFLVLLYGVLKLVAALEGWALSRKGWDVAIGPLLHGAFYLLIGWWTRVVAEHFRRATTTTGADIPHLMSALEQLQRLYAFQRTVIAALLILVILWIVGTVLIGL